MMNNHIFTKSKILMFILFSVCALTLALCPGPKAAEDSKASIESPLALINGTIIDGIDNEPIDDGIVVIEGEKITAVGKKNNVKIPNGSKIIDVQGATIMPGLINAHVHNAYFKKHAAIWAACGVTTVRDLSCGRNEVEKSIIFRNQARKDPEFCRIISSGSMITVPWGYMSNYGINVRKESDARVKINRELDAGVDFIKITFQEPSFPQFSNLSPKLAAFIVSLAHKRGVYVTAHIGTTRDLKTALDSGVNDIAHIPNNELTNDLIQRMVKNGLYMEPTLTNWATSKGRERAMILSNFKRYIDAGGQIALGAEHIPTAKHAGAFVGMPVQEFLMMQEAGMTPMQIIKASTINAARVCRIDNILGSIEPGKVADILVLNASPLTDLKNFSNAKMVIHQGVIIRKEG